MVIALRILGWELLALTLGNDQAEGVTTSSAFGFTGGELAERAPTGWIPDEHYR